MLWRRQSVLGFNSLFSHSFHAQCMILQVPNLLSSERKIGGRRVSLFQWSACHSSSICSRVPYFAPRRVCLQFILSLGNVVVALFCPLMVVAPWRIALCFNKDEQKRQFSVVDGFPIRSAGAAWCAHLLRPGNAERADWDRK